MCICISIVQDIKARRDDNSLHNLLIRLCKNHNMQSKNTKIVEKHATEFQYFVLKYTALQMILLTESTRFYKLDKTCPSKRGPLELKPYVKLNISQQLLHFLTRRSAIHLIIIYQYKNKSQTNVHFKSLIGF